MTWSIILSVLAFTIAANLDNLGVCIAYGTNGTRIIPPSNLLIAVISGTATALSIGIGEQLAAWAGINTARVLGMAGMVLIGGWVCLKAVVDGWILPGQQGPREVYSLHVRPLGLIVSILKEPFNADLDQSKTIDLREALFLGAALAANCLASGVALGMLDLPLAPTALAVAAGSFGCTHLGWKIGKTLGSRWPAKRTGLTAGLLLMAMALFGLK